MMKFSCTVCNFIFDHEGIKDEYISATYGPCFKYIAYCPACDAACDEYRTPSVKKSGGNACSSGGRCSCCG